MLFSPLGCFRICFNSLHFKGKTRDIAIWVSYIIFQVVRLAGLGLNTATLRCGCVYWQSVVFINKAFLDGLSGAFPESIVNMTVDIACLMKMEAVHTRHEPLARVYHQFDCIDAVTSPILPGIVNSLDANTYRAANHDIGVAFEVVATIMKDSRNI